MPDDPTVEFLAIVHHIVATSEKTQQTLLNPITVEDGFAVVPYELLEATAALLKIQTKLLANLVEENQEIVDRVASLAATSKE